MHDKIKAFYAQVDQVHSDLFAQLLRLEEELKTETSIEELADWTLVMREANAHLDQLASKTRAMQDTAVKMGCAIFCVLPDNHKYVQKQAIKTAYCTAKPDLKYCASIPNQKKDPEKYYALTDYLGIHREHAEKRTVRVHWPTFVDLITELTQEGKPLPPGIDATATYPVYKMTVRRNRSILDA